MRLLLTAGLGLGPPARIALAAETTSITGMEIVDNALALAIPGAMDVAWIRRFSE